MTNPRLTILGGLAIIVLSLASAWPVFQNQLVQDDVPLAEKDERIQDLSNINEMVTTPFWPDAGPAGHHRPAMTVSLALQWAAGQGRPVAFKIISVTLATAAALAVFALAVELLPLGWAWVVAAAFAVHPVHVEAIAVAINQGELVIALAYTLLLRWFLLYRRVRDTTWRDRSLMAGVMTLAVFFKETGIVLPALLVAAEVCFPNGRSLRERWGDLRPTILLQVLVVLIVVVIRGAVLGGDVRGTFTAEGLEGLSMGERGLTMLGVVPEYLRLLYFPAALQADYSPGEILPATSFGAQQFLGLAIIVLAVLLLARSARTYPVIVFGGLWTVICLGPVSNVIIPSGIVLAERTLYLPSLGALLLFGGVLTAASALAAPIQRRWIERGVAVIVLLLIALGVSRSHSRFGVWRDQRTLWTQTVIDAPQSYRALLALGSLLTHPAYQDMSLRFVQRGLEEFKSPAAMFALSSRLQERNRCAESIEVVREALALKEFAPGRSEYLACLTWEGRYDEARVEALQGLRSGYWAPVFRRWYHWLDTVRVAQSPRRTKIAPPEIQKLWSDKVLDPEAYQLQPPLSPPGPPWVGP